MSVLQFGAVFPTTEIGDDPALIRDYAQTAEGLGYSRLLVYDHVLGAVHADREPPLTGPYTEHDAFHEPMVLLGFLAACTTRIELQVAVLVLPQRQTALVAKQAAEIAVLSAGRLSMAVGIGWNTVEYESLGVPFARRGARLDEQLHLMRRLWTEPVVDFEGEWHRVDRAGLKPLPPRIPVLFGGSSDAAFRRAARTGDGFVFGSAGARTNARLERLERFLDEHGRTPADFSRQTMIDYSLGPDAWVEEATEWERRGGAALSVRTMRTGAEYHGVPVHELPSPAAHLAALGEFADTVGLRTSADTVGLRPSDHDQEETRA